MWLGWVDTYIGLIMLYTAFSLPYVIWMMRGYIEDIPLELEESALVDGCSRWEVLWKVVFPWRAPASLPPLYSPLSSPGTTSFLHSCSPVPRSQPTPSRSRIIWRPVEFLVQDRRHVGAWDHSRLHRRRNTAALSGARHIHGRSQGLGRVGSEDHRTSQALRRSTTRSEGIDLEVPSGEFTVLVGPSGCGKSTLLRTIAGLEEASAGTIEIGGKDVTWARPRDRDIAMVFQNYALYPYLNVHENIAFGLRARKVASVEADKRVKRAAEMLGIAQLLQRFPRELSGGQRQRVAIGRAIVRDALLFLFDEPLSNLDAQLRDDMRVEIKRLHQELGRTMIYVTHDQIEAMTLADRIALLRDGRIEQLGAPLDLFERPATRFVAGFLGSPKMNFLPATIESGDVTLRDGTKLPLPPGRKAPNGQAVILGLRPQHIAKAGTSAAPGHVAVAVNHRARSTDRLASAGQHAARGKQHHRGIRGSRGHGSRR